jgi:MFS family permease
MANNFFINKNFFLLWTGKIVSQVGDKFYGIALAWWILQRTNSPMAMGLFMAASTLPGLILGPFAGTLIDRWNRKHIIIISDVVRGLLVMVTALLSAWDILALWHIFLAAIVISLASAFFDPTAQAIIPQLVTKDQLSRANALGEMVTAFSMIIGPVFGALSLSLLGFTWVFLINGLSYLVSAFFECFITLPCSRNSSMKKSNLWFEMKEGLKFLYHRPNLIIVISIIGITHLFVGCLMVVLPFLAKELGGNTVQNLGNLEMMLGSGMFLGATYIHGKIKNITQERNLFRIIFLMGVLFTSIGLTKYMINLSLLPYLLLIFLVGTAIANASICWRSLLQLHTPAHMTGRVFSISSMVGNVSLPISYGLFGLLLNYLPISLLMTVSGICLFLIGTTLIGFNKLHKPAAQ